MKYHDIPLPDIQRTAPETTDSPIQMKYDVEQQGYVVEEYYISGQADIYESVTMADSMNRQEQDPTKSMARRDFNRPVIKADVNYTTRILVHRPKDPVKFSGNAVIEPVHPLDSGVLAVWVTARPFFLDNGDVYVGIQHPSTFAVLKKFNEKQIESYLKDFVIPEDYKTQILQHQAKLSEAYNDVEVEENQLQANLGRLKKQYQRSHISEQEYLSEYKSINRQLAQLNPVQDKQEEIQKLANFLANAVDAWKEANQEQRNKLAKILFEEIKLDNGGKVIAVKPRAGFEPFFRLSYDCHRKDIGYDPEGI